MPRQLSVLLTGAAGFIGSEICRQLLDRGHEVVALVSFEHRGTPVRLSEVARSSRLHLIRHDLRCPIDPRLLTPGVEWTIINAASESHVQRSIIDPVPFVRNNVDLVLSVLELARKVRCRLLLQVSTDEVYGPTDGTSHGRHAPWDPIRPSNPYAASKACQEALMHAWGRAYSIPVCVTNTMNNFGPWQDAEKFVPMAISKAMEGQSIPVHVGPDGASGTRCWIPVEEHVRQLVMIAEDFPNGVRSREHLVGQQASNLDIVRMVGDALGVSVKPELVEFHSRNPAHDLHYGLIPTRAVREDSLVQGIERTVRWYLDHPGWLGISVEATAS